MPVRVRGVTYPSAQFCANALGVTRKAVYNALARGTPDRIGLDNAAGKARPFKYRMLSWPSRNAASRALGMDEGYISRQMNGTTRQKEILAERLEKYIRHTEVKK
jgi:hypothetical protein